MLRRSSCLLLVVITVVALDAQDSFKARVAAFEARAKEMHAAVDAEARGAATLAWLRALRSVIGIDRVGAAEKRWLTAHEDLVFYNEVGGQWMIQPDAIWRAHERVKGTAAADDIAWLAVTNGLGGECEGYVPCYAYRMDRSEGEYLRRHPRGRHSAEALQGLDDLLTSVLNDLLKRSDKSDFLKVPDDCAELLKSARPLRAAVAGAQHDRKASTLRLIDRLIQMCPAE